METMAERKHAVRRMGLAAAAIVAAALLVPACASKPNSDVETTKYGSSGSVPPSTTTEPITTSPPVTGPVKDPVDVKDAEGVLLKLIGQQLASRTPRETATDPLCPSPEPKEIGVHFTCTIEIGGVTVPYDVSIVAKDGHLEYLDKAEKVLMSMPRVEAGAEQNLANANPGAIVTCVAPGLDLVLMSVGQQFTCNIAWGSGRAHVQATVTSMTGHVSFGHVVQTKY